MIPGDKQAYNVNICFTRLYDVRETYAAQTLRLNLWI